MSPRRRKAEDADVFRAMGRLMRRVGPDELTLVAIAAEAGVTASALVQRFGSRRELILTHWRQTANPARDLRPRRTVQDVQPQSPLEALRAIAAVYAKLAASPRAALRNLAYMQHDCADPVIRRHVLRHARAARAHFAQLLAAAVSRGELRPETDVTALAQMIDVTLLGSLLSWALHRDGPAATYFRYNLDAALRPHLTDAATNP
jgi:AcrR family transcriptional regulator